MQLSEINAQYEHIMQSDMTDTERDKALAALMDFMEWEYKIPALVSSEWEEKHRTIIALYRKLSMSRTTV